MADHRQVVEGIVFRYRTGVAWRDLPERFDVWVARGRRTDGGLAVQLRTLGAEVRVCAPPDCAELLARVGMALVPIGVWR